MRSYEWRHIVSFEDTNVVGNVYYVNHISWQGRCREMFIREHAPEIVDEIAAGLALATTRCSCEYLEELSAFDKIALRMRLGRVAQNRITLLFEYWRERGASKELVARGEQQIACMRRESGRVIPAPVPEALQKALAPYAHGSAAELGASEASRQVSNRPPSLFRSSLSETDNGA